MGVCIEILNVCILMEYCLKGVLVDVFLNDDILFMWFFWFLFVVDIVNGMDYFYSYGFVYV